MNKSKLKLKAKAILNDNPIGYVFTPDQADYNFLLRIFQGHPEYMIKTKVGIRSIHIGIGGEFKTRCFIITRLDGSVTDISYIRSIDGATTKISDIKCACRSAIDSIIIAFRKSIAFGFDTCPFTGAVLLPENTHIDHYDLTFNEVVEKWLKTENIDVIHSLLNDSTKDNETKIYFTSDALVKDFIQYHNENTHLRAVSKTANLSILKKVKS